MKLPATVSVVTIPPLGGGRYILGGLISSQFPWRSSSGIYALLTLSVPRRHLGASSAVANQRNREHNHHKMMRKFVGISVVLLLLFAAVAGANGGDFASTKAKAEQGEAIAQFNLGWMYEKGLGVIKDETEAAKWYRKAADQGYVSAQSSLGGMYAEGGGVIKDEVRAYMWFLIAGSNGNEIAKANFGKMERWKDG
ncbi:MAG: hypothetical protein ACI9OD_001572 [Limisphaerales bacterium]